MTQLGPSPSHVDLVTDTYDPDSNQVGDKTRADSIWKNWFNNLYVWLGENVSKDFFFEVAQGNVTGYMSLHKFGGNDAVGTTFEDIWGFTSDLTYLTTASVIHLISSDTNDNQAGSGARSCHIFGLDANFELQDEVLNMHATVGTTAGDSSTNTYIRIYRVHVEDCGTYGGSNEGNISIIEDTGSSVQAYIEIGAGQSEMTHYTIPANKTGYIKRTSVSMDTGKAVDINIIIRENADDSTAPVRPERSIHHWHGVDIPLEEVFFAHTPLLEKTDVRMQGLVSSGSAKIEVDYDLIIRDN